MEVELLHLDGALPNLALMRIAQHHITLGDSVKLRRVHTKEQIAPDLFSSPDKVYASAIFEKTQPLVRHTLDLYPDAIVGGTGWDMTVTLANHGIEENQPNYEVYPDFQPSIGFTQRGCRLRCKFCVVPKKEGAVVEDQTIGELYRGEPWPRQLILLDNDFFGQPRWDERIGEIIDGGFRVSFCQGINVRLITEEIAAAVASVQYSDSKFKARRLYVAWDNRKDERIFFRGMNLLKDAGVKPSSIMVYMLIGYWPGETHEDRDYRRAGIRAFGADPYPMPFTRTPELVGFQRWVVRHTDKIVPWDVFASAGYQPRAVRYGHAQRNLF